MKKLLLVLSLSLAPSIYASLVGGMPTYDPRWQGGNPMATMEMPGNSVNPDVCNPALMQGQFNRVAPGMMPGIQQNYMGPAHVNQPYMQQ